MLKSLRLAPSGFLCMWVHKLNRGKILVKDLSNVGDVLFSRASSEFSLRSMIQCNVTYMRTQ